MKKVLSLALVLVLMLTLAGCKNNVEGNTIRFELNGGNGQSTLIAKTGEEITLPSPTKDGFDFDGWYLDEALTNVYASTTMPSIDLELYAKWVLSVPTIFLELNGGTGTSSVSEEVGSAIIVDDPTKEGYIFKGWFVEATFLTEYNPTTMPNEDLTLYAKWEMPEFTLTIVSNITEATPDMITNGIVNGEQTYMVTASVVEGFTFNHWRVFGTTTKISDDAEFVYSLSMDVTLEAVYFPTVVEPELYYESSFEDGAKASYATAEVVLSGETWNFNDSLIGSLATDLSVSGNSVRIRNGYIETLFNVSDLAQVIFYAGTYGNDSDGLVTFQISSDSINWVTVDSFTSSGTLEEHNYIFDNAMFSNLSLDASASYYFKITSSESGRTNIDDFKIYTGEGSLVDNTPLYSLSFTEDMNYSYLLDEVVDLDNCLATHPTLGVTDCDIFGSVDTSVAGAYEVTYSKTDEFGNTVIEVVTITVISEVGGDLLLIDLMTYYDDAEGLHGTDLMDALHTIINTGFTGVTYGEARYILDDSDADPDIPGNIILVYLGTSINGNWDSGVTWNREHIWPQSLLGVSADNGKVNSASDLYNLMPSNPGENSARGNSAYSDMGLGYEPRDEVKGDVARALFYMMIMYGELDLVNSAPGVHEMGYLNELLEWHFEDPVDEFEMNRLEVIFGAQNNRNPFVDYPHFVNLIWFFQDTTN